jgi:hypothetical protein
LVRRPLSKGATSLKAVNCCPSDKSHDHCRQIHSAEGPDAEVLMSEADLLRRLHLGSHFDRVRKR